LSARFLAAALCSLPILIASAQTASQAPAAASGAKAAEPPLVSSKGPPSFVYPQRRELDGNSLVLHAPQIRSWPNFEHFEAWMAIEYTPADKTGVRYATASITGDTEVDLETRLVKVRQPKIADVLFASPSTPPSYAETIKKAATRKELDVPLDLFLAALADDVLETSAPSGFNTKPPKIHVRNAPTILLYQNGEAVLQPLEKTKLQVMANANWPTFKDPKTSKFYLLAGERWLTAGKVEGPWSATTTLPAEFNQISASGPNAPIRAQIPPKSSTQPVPTVLFSKEPAEVIVIEGAAKLETIPKTAGLSYVSNTASPLFQLAGDWYFLAAGRWFATKNLNKGPWTFVSELPDAFRLIPADHAMAAVRASVPGTTEARMAVLEATLPKKNAVARDAKPSVQVTYAGDPQFEPIEKTGVSRAVNTSFDVLQVQNTFYLCYQGAWYQSTNANGPWALAASVPAAIYTIPPSSPSYHVTQVVIKEATTTTVVYEYPPSYSSNVWVAYGCVVYGTGWYYPPYYGYGYYYPYYGGSYGYGTWYNPATGGYGSRSVYYGPYGGYSYNQAYNPNTGRYGSMETAWNGNEWASQGQTYNPRTGVSTETSRNYDRYSRESSMERTVERGDNSITTERNTDFREGTQEVSRETSRGGSQESQRQVQNGQMTGSGTIETGGGRTIETESSASGGKGTISMSGSEGGSGTINTSRDPAGGGATREGTFTSGSGETLNTSTERQGRDSRTDFETSTGGSGTSIKNDGNRTTIAESGSGDLYAGHNGNVYKKSEDGGWSHYQDGNWKTVDMPSKEQRQQANSRESASAGQQGQQRSPTATQQGQTRSQSPNYSRPSSMESRPSTSSRDMSQLKHDYSARQTGNRQYSQRSMGGMRGGGGRRR
jgi:hypothetical protein